MHWIAGRANIIYIYIYVIYVIYMLYIYNFVSGVCFLQFLFFLSFPKAPASCGEKILLHYTFICMSSKSDSQDF